MVGFRDFLLNGIKQYYPTICGPRSYDLVIICPDSFVLFSFENLPSAEGERLRSPSFEMEKFTNHGRTEKKKVILLGWKGHLPVPTYPHEPNKHVDSKRWTAPFFLTLGDFFMAFFVTFFGIFFRAGAEECISLGAGFDTSRKGFVMVISGKKKIQWFLGKT